MKIDTLTTTLLVFALVGFTGEQKRALADLSQPRHVKAAGKWRFRPQKGDAPFCGVKSGACSALKVSVDEAKHEPVTEPTKAVAGNPIPLFDIGRDGPLLKESKKIDLLTTAGDIHLQIDPQLAPEHATQLFRLFKSGAYNGTPIHRM